jgi:DNA polymerase (family 10)
VHNAAVADIFDEIALLLDLKDENPFRIRAYRRAALSLRGLSEDVEALAARDALATIPGVGPDLSAKIKEYLATGKVRFHEELCAKTPPVLLEMLEIPGVGPKHARLIYRRLKPRSIDALEKLGRAGRIRTLPGLREKAERNILDGIALVKKGRERTLLGKALPLARRLAEALAKAPGARRVEVAGSVRRRCETVRDIDILAASSSPKPVSDAFVRNPEVWKVNAHGETKSSVILRDRLQVDLRVVGPEEFGAALLYFTGSKTHNIKLRALAKKRGWKINEYGLFDERTGKRIAGRTEEEIYKALGLAYVEPEMREDQGEIEAAAKGRLPRLVEAADVKGDLHLHSRWSDGSAEIARRHGYAYAVLTDHSQSLRVAHGLSPKTLLKQVDEVRRTGRKLKGFTLLAGSEVDILEDGSLDFKDEVLRELDFVVASVHSGFKQPREKITRRIVKAMRNRYVRVIGHPTGRLLGERNPYAVDLEEVFKVARETNTALELNASPQRLDLDAVHARRARECGVTLAIDTDSHHPDQFANLEYGVATARRAWCAPKDILNCLDLAAFRKRIAK